MSDHKLLILVAFAVLATGANDPVRAQTAKGAQPAPPASAESQVEADLESAFEDSDDEPPPPKQEAQPAAPSTTHVWVAGFWGRRNHAWVWIPGRWIAGRPGCFWQAGRWERIRRRFRWVRGHWVCHPRRRR